MKAKSKSFSVYPKTLEEIEDIVQLKLSQDPGYSDAKCVREAVYKYWCMIKRDLDDKRYEEGALNG
jgi:hypothetical protein